MKPIDINWLRKVLDRHNKFDRSCPLGSNSMRCTQEIFIDRYFAFLAHKTFKLKVLGKVYWAMFLPVKLKQTSCSDNTSETHINYGVRKHLGYNGSEFDLSFLAEKGSMKHIDKIHFNELCDIKYEEVSHEDFYNVLKLFN